MLTYGDPELLIGAWLETQGFTVRADPDLRADYWADAPLVHLQRGQSFGPAPLSLDDAVLDIDVYGADAAHVRQVAQDVWAAMVLRLPLTTFNNGAFVTLCQAVSAPAWAPDPTAFRRTAAYRVILHGFVSQP